MIRLTFEPPSFFRLADGQSSIDLFPSDVFGDPLSALADAVIALMKERFTLESTVRVVCKWQDEPGEYRWILEKDGDKLRITIVHFDDNFSNMYDEEGKLLFTTECSALKFAIQIRTQLRDLLEELGPEGNKTLTRRPFPMEQYGTLQEVIRKEELKRKSQRARP